jgi:hypothetical protein
MPDSRYRLIDGDGTDLGLFVSSTDWPVGGLIPRGDGYLRVTAVVEPEAEENFRAYLVVESFNMAAESKR